MLRPPQNGFLFCLTICWSDSKKQGAHPLISGSVFHYEFEFIHPFMDGNGRLGRLWQTLILGCWKPIFFMIPIESVIRDRQTDYYGALRSGDEAGNSATNVRRDSL